MTALLPHIPKRLPQVTVALLCLPDPGTEPTALDPPLQMSWTSQSTWTFSNEQDTLYGHQSPNCGKQEAVALQEWLQWLQHLWTTRPRPRTANGRTGSGR